MSEERLQVAVLVVCGFILLYPAVYLLAKAVTLGVLRGKQIFADQQKTKPHNP